MTIRRDLSPDATVLATIEALLLSVLPVTRHVLVPTLAAGVAEHPDVAPHADKRWGQLTEGEGNVIAREVGMAARGLLHEGDERANPALH